MNLGWTKITFIQIPFMELSLSYNIIKDIILQGGHNNNLNINLNFALIYINLNL